MKTIQQIHKDLNRDNIFPPAWQDWARGIEDNLNEILHVMEAQQKEIEELKDTVAYHAGVLKGIQNQEMRRHGWAH